MNAQAGGRHARCTHPVLVVGGKDLCLPAIFFVPTARPHTQTLSLLEQQTSGGRRRAVQSTTLREENAVATVASIHARTTMFFLVAVIVDDLFSRSSQKLSPAYDYTKISTEQQGSGHSRHLHPSIIASQWRLTKPTQSHAITHII